MRPSTSGVRNVEALGSAGRSTAGDLQEFDLFVDHRRQVAAENGQFGVQIITDRHEGHVIWDDDAAAWLVLGHRAACQILGTAGWTSNPLANPTAAQAIQGFDPDLLGRNMLSSDGATHQRLRAGVGDVFTRSFITQLRDGIEAIVRNAVDTIPGG